jgi:hypothetical protein
VVPARYCGRCIGEYPEPRLNGFADPLVTLSLLDGSGTLTAQALTTVPTMLTFTNSLGRVTGTTTVSVAVGRPAGINIPVGRARGLGVYSYDGTPTTAAQRTSTSQTAPLIGQFGFPATTWSGTQAITIASNGTLSLPIVFGLAGVSTGVSDGRHRRPLACSDR